MPNRAETSSPLIASWALTEIDVSTRTESSADTRSERLRLNGLSGMASFPLRRSRLSAASPVSPTHSAEWRNLSKDRSSCPVLSAGIACGFKAMAATSYCASELFPKVNRNEKSHCAWYAVRFLSTTTRFYWFCNRMGSTPTVTVAPLEIVCFFPVRSK